MKKLLIIFLLLIPIAFATINGPYVNYVDYGITYDLKQSLGAESNLNASVQCLNSLGQTFPLTSEVNSGDTIYTCEFEYTAPSSGKGVNTIDYTLKFTDQYSTTEFTDRYTLYYGYCPNVACPSSQECVNHQCQLLCGNNKIDPGETCSSCPQDVTCNANEKCTNNVCQVYCGNKQIDLGETCSSCPQDVVCQSYEQCTLGVCQGFCGNKKKDLGETCSSCPQDAYCESTQRCVQGACEGYCGTYNPEGCWCDASCVDYGDCCYDACDECGSCEGAAAGKGVVGERNAFAKIIPEIMKDGNFWSPIQLGGGEESSIGSPVEEAQ